MQEAAARGFGASARVILGSATADLLLVGPALAASWVIAQVDALAFYVALVGAAYFLYLAVEAARDSRRLWLSSGASAAGSGGWAFAKGVLGNLTNPLAWAFWLATGTPTMLRPPRPHHDQRDDRLDRHGDHEPDESERVHLTCLRLLKSGSPTVIASSFRCYTGR